MCGYLVTMMAMVMLTLKTYVQGTTVLAILVAAARMVAQQELGNPGGHPTARPQAAAVAAVRLHWMKIVEHLGKWPSVRLSLLLLYFCYGWDCEQLQLLRSLYAVQATLT